MGRSPIEVMIDKACGVNPSSTAVEQKATMKEGAEALYKLADAAAMWIEEGSRQNPPYELWLAALRLKELGWGSGR